MQIPLLQNRKRLLPTLKTDQQQPGIAGRNIIRSGNRF
jgi:hypothetical protein